ncbi:MAG: hypothetical protein NT106_09130 [Candidatus Sumerlaeota bacterium]|nr:hypothetical protein [Candidatus Sumerlaeota bacterium]
MRLQRRTVAVYKKGADMREKSAVLSKAEALSFVWELTEEVYSLTGRHDVKSRLQRDVVVVNRKQR